MTSLLRLILCLFLARFVAPHFAEAFSFFGNTEKKETPEKSAPQTLLDYAKILGYKNEEELKKEYPIFSERIKAGFAPNGFFEKCASEQNKNLCETLKIYFDENSRKSLSSKRKKKQNSLVRFELKYLERLQSTDFPILNRKTSTLSLKRALIYKDHILKSKGCPQNLSLALAAELEEKNVANSQWKDIDALWEKGLSCVNSEMPWAEYVFLRAALSFRARGMLEKSLGFLNSALEAKESNEGYRVHYWKYRTLVDLKQDAAAKTHAEELGKLYPISWYWINAAHDIGVDPLEKLRSRPSIPDEFQMKNEAYNLALFWLKTGLKLEENPKDITLFAEWVVRKSIEEKNIGLSQHLTELLFEAKLYRLQILGLSKVVLEQPDALNFSHLQALFPKPYFEEMKQHSGALDTAVLLGLARQESGFDTFAKSAANARGLLQLLPSTARGLSKGYKNNDLYNYERNIQLGSKYILRLLERFEGSLEHSLGAYNAGATHMRRWQASYPWAAKDLHVFLDIIPFRETRDYAPSILRNAYWYHRLFPSLKESENGKVISGALLSALLQKVEATTGKVPAQSSNR